jgi:hypothetical protein
VPGCSRASDPTALWIERRDTNGVGGLTQTAQSQNPALCGHILARLLTQECRVFHCWRRWREVLSTDEPRPNPLKLAFLLSGRPVEQHIAMEDMPRWEELCKRAAVEQDPKKLLDL